MIQWGEATGDQNLQNLGEYLYNSEVNAFYDYYFNENPNTGTFPPGFSTTTDPRTNITVVSDNGGSQTTFFGLETSKVLGFSILPINGSSYYLAGRLPTIAANTNYINENVANALKNPATERRGPDLGRRLFDHHLRLSGPLRPRRSALTAYMAKLNADNLTPFNGNGSDNNAINLQWINVLLQYGNVDTTVTANTVNYVAFNKSGVRTYVAFNPEPYASKVTFKLPGGTTYTLDLPCEVGGGPDRRYRRHGDEHGHQRHTRPRHRHLREQLLPRLERGEHDVGHADAGPERHWRAVADDPAGTGTAANPIDQPPANPAKVLSFSASGLNGILDPTQLPQFSIWLDPGYITTNVTRQAPVICAELTIDPDCGTEHDISEIFDGTVNLALSKPGYVEYNSSEVQVLDSARLAHDPDQRHGHADLWERIGTTAVRDRTDAAEQQGRSRH